MVFLMYLQWHLTYGVKECKLYDLQKLLCAIFVITKKKKQIVYANVLVGYIDYTKIYKIHVCGLEKKKCLSFVYGKEDELRGIVESEREETSHILHKI